jgi:hypothetical protein
LESALQTLEALETEMMGETNRVLGFNAVIQTAKYCGIVSEIAAHATIDARTRAQDRIKDCMIRIHGMLAIPAPGEPVQLNLFNRK